MSFERVSSQEEKTPFYLIGSEQTNVAKIKIRKREREKEKIKEKENEDQLKKPCIYSSCSFFLKAHFSTGKHI